jgi:hypothetical protein
MASERALRRSRPEPVSRSATGTGWMRWWTDRHLMLTGAAALSTLSGVLAAAAVPRGAGHRSADAGAANRRAMMRRMLIGIKQRAEAAETTRQVSRPADEPLGPQHDQRGHNALHT